MSYKIPKNEKLWVRISEDGSRITHLITSTWPLRDKYILYQIQEDGTLKKLGSGVNPSALEEKYLWKDLPEDVLS